MFYRQLAPIYGENSAPKRWEDTLFEWLEDKDPEETEKLGFVRGENEPCVLYHPERDLVIMVYVDDILADGNEEDIKWFFDKLANKFDCKDDEWLTEDNPIDFLGMEISMDDDNLYLSMGPYVEKMLTAMHMQECAPVDTPINQEIEDFSEITKDLRKRFMMGVGCVGWLVNTVRLDASLAHSRIAQHMANPCKGAWSALVHLMKYFQGTRNLCLYQPLDSSDDTHGWRFYCDSDFASNTFSENKRRSQNGYVAMEGTAPVQWGSKVSSVAFAHPDIAEAHADVSSGAAEVYAAANATFEFLHLSYVVDEIGNIPFPKPLTLEMDNTTAECFVNNTAFKSKLKHIDVRQQWVKTLRDKSIIIPKHVNTNDNLADIFTKVLCKATFTRLRDQLMLPRP